MRIAKTVLGKAVFVLIAVCIPGAGSVKPRTWSMWDRRCGIAAKKPWSSGIMPILLSKTDFRLPTSLPRQTR